MSDEQLTIASEDGVWVVHTADGEEIAVCYTPRHVPRLCKALGIDVPDEVSNE